MVEPRFPVLFIAPGRIGDAVLCSGLVARLAAEAPHARFTVAGSPLVLPLFRDLPGLDALIPLEKRRFSLHWLGLWRRVRGRRWGLVLDMRGSALARVLRARRRAVRTPLPAGTAPVHKVLEAARVLRLEDDPPPPHLFTSAETRAEAARLLGEDSGPVLALAPVANWVGKMWPVERFAQLAARLTGPDGPLPGARVLLLGGPQDRAASEPVRRAVPRARMIDAVGRIDLLTAYAALARARLFVGNDSGLMHLAAAAGAPTLGLFGPSDDRLYAPWGPQARALRGPRSFEAFTAVDPALNQAMSHMRDLPLADVTQAAIELLAATAPAFEPEPAAERETHLG